VELDHVLPDHYEFEDLLLDLDPLKPMDPYFVDFSHFQIVGLRSPPSAFVTLKGIPISDTERILLEATQRATWVLKDSH